MNTYFFNKETGCLIDAWKVEPPVENEDLVFLGTGRYKVVGEGVSIDNEQVVTLQLFGSLPEEVTTPTITRGTVEFSISPIPENERVI